MGLAHGPGCSRKGCTFCSPRESNRASRRFFVLTPLQKLVRKQPPVQHGGVSTSNHGPAAPGSEQEKGHDLVRCGLPRSSTGQPLVLLVVVL